MGFPAQIEASHGIQIPSLGVYTPSHAVGRTYFHEGALMQPVGSMPVHEGSSKTGEGRLVSPWEH